MAEAALPRVHRAAPEVPVAEMARALDYYEQRLGFRAVMTMPDGDYAVVERDDVALHLFAGEGASPVSFHLFASNIDALSKELEGRGALLTQPVTVKPWGTRDFRVKDPFGNEIKFSEPAG